MGGTPIAGRFIRGNPIKLDDLRFLLGETLLNWMITRGTPILGDLHLGV